VKNLRIQLSNTISDCFLQRKNYLLKPSKCLEVRRRDFLKYDNRMLSPFCYLPTRQIKKYISLKDSSFIILSKLRFHLLFNRNLHFIRHKMKVESIFLQHTSKRMIGAYIGISKVYPIWLISKANVYFSISLHN